MDNEIIVAIIGAAATVVVALISLIGKKNKLSKTAEDEKKTEINQKAEGANSTLIGIQINHEKRDDHHE